MFVGRKFKPSPKRVVAYLKPQQVKSNRHAWDRFLHRGDKENMAGNFSGQSYNLINKRFHPFIVLSTCVSDFLQNHQPWKGDTHADVSNQ
jgi:hypothetical protein